MSPELTFSLRALLVFTCVLTLAESNACAHTASSAYRETPPSFAGAPIVPNRGGGFSVRILTGMLPPGPPLYIVDGIRMSVDPVRGIDWIQPTDIIALRLLKDPSEISIYGESGTSGVVLITTKQSLKRLK